MHGFCRRPTAFLLASTLILATACSTSGEDFRIETKVYQGDEKVPVSETVTLFQSGVVYDFLSTPPQIAVFRKPAGDVPGRFILLDPVRRLRTELTTDEIAAALEKFSKWAAEQPDPLLRFAAHPQFDESFDPESGQLVLASYLRTYRLETSAAPKPAALAQYREFLDWYARLNALHTRLPPQPRLAVNASLARHAVIPTKVELTQSASKKPVRAEHDFTWRLSQEDRSRIDEVRDALGRYREVDNEQFLAAQAKGIEK